MLTETVRWGSSYSAMRPRLSQVVVSWKVLEDGVTLVDIDSFRGPSRQVMKIEKDWLKNCAKTNRQEGSIAS